MRTESSLMMDRFRMFPDEGSLFDAAAQHVVKLAQNTVPRKDAFNMALSGGLTSAKLYARMARSPIRERTPWDSIQVFFSDERCVPPDHPDSNYRMARENLLSLVSIPEDHIHRIRGEIDPAEAAESYEKMLRDLFQSGTSGKKSGEKTMDLILLGLGTDGHTASLFPGSPSLYDMEKWVTALYVEKLRTWRITLTPAFINRAAHVIFMVTGREKAMAVNRTLCDPFQPQLLPAQSIQPGSGDVVWFVDEDAGSKIRKRQ